jgi:hypothetical protein
VERRYLAVSTTLLYGQVTNLAAHRNAAAFIRECEPTARTTTFLIYERDALVERLQRALDSTSRLSEPARRTEHQQQTGPKAK